VRGLHGLHVYATEYWTEHLLYLAKSTGGLDKIPSVFALACRLVDKLSEPSSDGQVEELCSEPGLFENKLQALRQHPRLHKCVERALIARSLKKLESELLQTNGAYYEPTLYSLTLNKVGDENHRLPKEPSFRDGISTMLYSYQKVVKSLLDRHEFPGVSAEELEIFKNQFWTSAFTCRLSFCPPCYIGV